MKKSKFSEEQIIGILKEQEAGVQVAALAFGRPVTLNPVSSVTR